MQGLEQAETGKDPPSRTIGDASTSAAAQRPAQGQHTELQQPVQAGNQDPTVLQQSRGEPGASFQAASSRVLDQASLSMGGWAAPPWQAPGAALGSSTGQMQGRHLAVPQVPLPSSHQGQEHTHSSLPVGLGHVPVLPSPASATEPDWPMGAWQQVHPASAVEQLLGMAAARAGHDPSLGGTQGAGGYGQTMWGMYQTLGQNRQQQHQPEQPPPDQGHHSIASRDQQQQQQRLWQQRQQMHDLLSPEDPGLTRHGPMQRLGQQQQHIEPPPGSQQQGIAPAAGPDQLGQQEGDTLSLGPGSSSGGGRASAAARSRSDAVRRKPAKPRIVPPAPPAAPPAAVQGIEGAWLTVTCGALTGVLDLSDMMVRVQLETTTQKVPPAKFEAMAGKGSTRKWRRSLLVMPGGPYNTLTEPITLGEWLKKHQLEGPLATPKDWQGPGELLQQHTSLPGPSGSRKQQLSGTARATSLPAELSTQQLLAGIGASRGAGGLGVAPLLAGAGRGQASSKPRGPAAGASPSAATLGAMAGIPALLPSLGASGGQVQGKSFRVAAGGLGSAGLSRLPATMRKSTGSIPDVPLPTAALAPSVQGVAGGRARGHGVAQGQHRVVSSVSPSKQAAPKPSVPYAAPQYALPGQQELQPPIGTGAVVQQQQPHLPQEGSQPALGKPSSSTQQRSGGKPGSSGASSGGPAKPGKGGAGLSFKPALWVDVACDQLRGRLDLQKMSIMVQTGECAGQLLSPSKFEQLGGRGTTRKWRRSLTVVPTQQGDDPTMTLGEWMKKFQAEQQAALAARSSDTDPAAEGGGRYSSQEQDDDAPRPRRRKPPPIDPDTVWELDSRRKKQRKARTPSSAPASSGGPLQGSSLWPPSFGDVQPQQPPPPQQQQQQLGLGGLPGPPASSALPPTLPWPSSQQRPPGPPPSMLPPDPRRQPHTTQQQQTQTQHQQQQPQGVVPQEEAPHWQQQAASMLPPVPTQVLRMIPGLPAISQPPWAAQVQAPVSLPPQPQQQQQQQQQQRLHQHQQQQQSLQQQQAAAGYMPAPIYQLPPLVGPGTAPPAGTATLGLQGQGHIPSSSTRAGGPGGVGPAAGTTAGAPGHSRGTGSLDELPDDLGNIHDLFGPGLSEAELSEVLRELAPGSTPIAGGTPGSQRRHPFHVAKGHEPEGLLPIEEDALPAGSRLQQRVRGAAARGGVRDQGRPAALPDARAGPSRIGGAMSAPPPLTTPWSPTLPTSSSSKDAPGSGGSGEGSASHPGVRSMVPGAPLLMAPDDLMAHAPPALQLRGPVGQVQPYPLEPVPLGTEHQEQLEAPAGAAPRNLDASDGYLRNCQQS